MQAVKDAKLEKGIQRCCLVMGCFVHSQDYMPLLLAQLDAAAAPAAEAAIVAVLTALIQGAGKRS